MSQHVEKVTWMRSQITAPTKCSNGIPKHTGLQQCFSLVFPFLQRLYFSTQSVLLIFPRLGGKLVTTLRRFPVYLSFAISSLQHVKKAAIAWIEQKNKAGKDLSMFLWKKNVLNASLCSYLVAPVPCLRSSDVTNWFITDKLTALLTSTILLSHSSKSVITFCSQQETLLASIKLL